MQAVTPGMTATRIGDYQLARSLPATANVRAFEAAHLVLPRRALVRLAAPPVASELVYEACVLETLRGAGVPRIYECGLEGDASWVATELLDGPTLAESIAVPPTEVLALLRDVAEILHHAHVRGLVHGRLDPAAIVRHAGRVYVAEWLGRGCDPPDDIAALAAVIAPVIAAPPPRGLAQLVERMAASDVFARPTAAEVRAEALRLLEDEGDVEEVEIELVEDLSLAGGIA